MKANSTLKLNQMLKKSIISFGMIGIVALAAASSGGGDRKESNEARSGLLSLRSSPGVRLKAGPNYNEAQLNGASQFNLAMQHAVITYRKGNTIYIMPLPTRVSKPECQQVDFRSNLNLLRLQFKIPHR